VEYIDKTDGDSITWRGHKNFESMLVPIDSLELHPQNARQKHNVEGIAASLLEHGQQDVLKFTPDRLVIAGNGRLKAAQHLGWQYIAANEFTADDLRAVNYALADNRLAENSEWDYEMVAGQLTDLIAANFDPLKFGWHQHDLDVILQAEWLPVASEGDLGDLDRPGSGTPVYFDDEQFGIIEAAVKLLNERDGQAYSHAQALTLLSQDIV